MDKRLWDLPQCCCVCALWFKAVICEKLRVLYHVVPAEHSWQPEFSQWSRPPLCPIYIQIMTLLDAQCVSQLLHLKHECIYCKEDKATRRWVQIVGSTSKMINRINS